MRALLAAACFSFLVPAAARADEVLASYVAFLSMNDHYNSNGQRLSTPAQIIRQDRANFHRYGIIDEGDEWDPIFSSTDAREATDRLVSRGYTDPNIARSMMNNEIYVLVEILGNGGQLTAVNIVSW